MGRIDLSKLSGFPGQDRANNCLCDKRRQAGIQDLHQTPRSENAPAVGQSRAVCTGHQGTFSLAHGHQTGPPGYSRRLPEAGWQSLPGGCSRRVSRALRRLQQNSTRGRPPSATKGRARHVRLPFPGSRVRVGYPA